MECNITRDINEIFIYWTKNGTNSVCEEGLILEFESITRKDAGDYICHTNVSLPGDNDTNSDVIVEVVHIDVQCKLFYYYACFVFLNLYPYCY